MVIAVVLSAVIFFLGVGGGLLLYSGEWAFAVGVGLFTAFWGGPGFGIMAGMALYNLKIERLAAAAS